MNEQEIVERARAAGIGGIAELDVAGPDPFVVVEAQSLRALVGFLRDDPECCMEMLHNVTGVERADRLEVVYHLCSLARRHSLTVKVSLPRPQEGGGHGSWFPEVPSVADLYPSADWHEREQWDLMGIRFAGHPDLRRILLPEEWIGHPLRKDYAYPSEHGEIPLELDAVPMYERGADWERERKIRDAKRTPRPAGRPLRQPPAAPSRRPDAGGVAPPGSKGQLHVIGPDAGDSEPADGDGDGEGAH